MYIVLLIHSDDTQWCAGLEISAVGDDKDVDDSVANTRLTLMIGVQGWTCITVFHILKYYSPRKLPYFRLCALVPVNCRPKNTIIM